MTEPEEKTSSTIAHFAEEGEPPASGSTPMLSGAFRSLTPARVALHRAGASIATRECLEFQLAHARARDAVHAGLQPVSLVEALRSIPAVASLPKPGMLSLHSMAHDRQMYLQRPDMGRKLNAASLNLLEEIKHPIKAFGLSIVLADGLSALAIERNSVGVLTELFPLLQCALPSLSVAPICIIEQGRVAVGDEVAFALSAELVIVLIGERPGLSSPDSLGVYITWLGHNDQTADKNRSSEARPHITDADRNCISNIRTGGLSHAEACSRILYYITEARLRRQTGIALKDPDPGYRYLELPKDTTPEAREALLSAKDANDE
jgi:ethanolamine ammonia-lyase small subunit